MGRDLWEEKAFPHGFVRTLLSFFGNNFSLWKLETQMLPNRPWFSCLEIKVKKKEMCWCPPKWVGWHHRVTPQHTHQPVLAPRPTWDALEPYIALMKAARVSLMLNSLVNFWGPLNCEQDDPCSGKKSITSCQHTHIYKNMTVGQINLSRENRFFSNSVKCTELERERCYFSSMKGKQDLSCLSCLAHFKRRSV